MSRPDGCAFDLCRRHYLEFYQEEDRQRLISGIRKFLFGASCPPVEELGGAEVSLKEAA
jgi:hypothetical protein